MEPFGLSARLWRMMSALGLRSKALVRDGKNETIILGWRLTYPRQGPLRLAMDTLTWAEERVVRPFSQEPDAQLEVEHPVRDPQLGILRNCTLRQHLCFIGRFILCGATTLCGYHVLLWPKGRSSVQISPSLLFFCGGLGLTYYSGLIDTIDFHVSFLAALEIPGYLGGAWLSAK